VRFEPFERSSESECSHEKRRKVSCFFHPEIPIAHSGSPQGEVYLRLRFPEPAATVRAPALHKARKGSVIKRPVGSNPFEFAVVSGLRAAQLMRGCIPRVDRGTDKVITTAQAEVAAGLVARVPLEPPVLPGQ
jgi:DNA-directed RNA polymerase subunit K/omega